MNDDKTDEFKKALGADVVIPVTPAHSVLEMLALREWWNRRQRRLRDE